MAIIYMWCALQENWNVLSFLLFECTKREENKFKKLMFLSPFWFKDFLRQATAMFVTLQSKSVGDQQVNYYSHVLRY